MSLQHLRLFTLIGRCAVSLGLIPGVNLSGTSAKIASPITARTKARAAIIAPPAE